VTPPFTFDPFAEKPPGRPPSLVMRLVKPSFTADTALGEVKVEPYGPPTKNYSLLVLIAILAGFGLMAYGAYSVARQVTG
jgi:hypothetical protein